MIISSGKNLKNISGIFTLHHNCISYFIKFLEREIQHNNQNMWSFFSSSFFRLQNVKIYSEMDFENKIRDPLPPPCQLLTFINLLSWRETFPAVTTLANLWSCQTTYHFQSWQRSAARVVADRAISYVLTTSPVSPCNSSSKLTMKESINGQVVQHATKTTNVPIALRLTENRRWQRLDKRDGYIYPNKLDSHIKNI